jgi:DNA-binding MarR family transcriptional regulator
VTSTPPLTQSIGQAENALRAVLDRLLAETGTTFVQWVTLNMIARSGSAVQHEQLVRQIEAALKLEEPTVLATLGELSALGLLTPPGEAARVELTTVGDAQFQRLHQSIDSVTERLYGDLPMDDLVATRRVLGIVTERANAELGAAPHMYPRQ